MQKLQFTIIIVLILLPAAWPLEKYFDKFITSNPNLYFRTYWNYAKEALELWPRVEWQRYKLLYNGSVQVEPNCVEQMKELNLKSVSIYQFDIDESRCLHFLHQRLVMLFPSTKLPLAHESDWNKIDLMYPVFPEAVDVFRFEDNGFWFKVKNGTNFVNRYNIKINVPDVEAQEFQNAIESVMTIPERNYEQNCPVTATKRRKT